MERLGDALAACDDLRADRLAVPRGEVDLRRGKATGRLRADRHVGDEAVALDAGVWPAAPLERGRFSRIGGLCGRDALPRVIGRDEAQPSHDDHGQGNCDDRLQGYLTKRMKTFLRFRTKPPRSAL